MMEDIGEIISGIVAITIIICLAIIIIDLTKILNYIAWE